MQIFESGEMYLETILILAQQKDGVHAIDVANRMSYSKPSVSRALKLLAEGGFITVNSMSHIQLTEQGRRRAEMIFERHKVLSKVFSDLGVPEAIADTDACKIEHIISPETFAVIKEKLYKK